MAVLGNLPPVAVGGDLPVVGLRPCGVRQILDVIAHGQHNLIRQQPLVHQIQHQGIRHLPGHQLGLLKIVGVLQHLAGADGIGFGPVGLDVRHGAAFPAPGVVNQQLRVDAEEFV